MRSNDPPSLHNVEECRDLSSIQSGIWTHPVVYLATHLLIQVLKVLVDGVPLLRRTRRLSFLCPAVLQLGLKISGKPNNLLSVRRKLSRLSIKCLLCQKYVVLYCDQSR